MRALELALLSLLLLLVRLVAVLAPSSALAQPSPQQAARVPADGAATPTAPVQALPPPTAARSSRAGGALPTAPAQAVPPPTAARPSRAGDAIPTAPAQVAPPLTAARPSSVGDDRPWRAHEALGLPSLRFGIEHRSRFEHLDADFRSANPGDATAVSMRTLFSFELRFLPVVVGAELQDSRIWASETTPLNTNLADPLELLQGYVGLRAENVLARGDAALLTAGRMTIDLGSRRLVARNEFRNTINAFTGLDLQWTGSARDLVRAFAVVPVVRLPSAPEGLKDNVIELDRENGDALFWAVFFQSRPVAAQLTFEAYLLGLRERDSEIAPSSNRQLYTPGLRAQRPPTPGELDFQVEVMGQFGQSHASSAATDATALDHLAFSLHVSSGYRIDASWAPRVVLVHDYASGDRSPHDGANNRFDPLFGARRFDFGPTGLYGAIARSNVSSPGLRFEVQPHRTLDAFAGYRLIWLASARDAWTTAMLRDPTGDAGSFVGQQVEARIRWQVLPKNLSFEVGAALLIRGDLAKRAPSVGASPAAYIYSQVTGTI